MAHSASDLVRHHLVPSQSPPATSESHKRKADEALDLAFAREKVSKTRELIEL